LSFSEPKASNKNTSPLKKSAFLKLNKEHLDLHELINDAVEKISIQVEHKSGEVKTILNAERSIIFGDETHMLNVMLNLLENAVKYSKEAPSIMVRTESFKNYIQFYVKDRGVGMKKEAIKHIFDKFYRVPTGNVHDVKGYGLGLPYVKSIIEEHGGSISVESEPGKGSNFIIKLPLSHE
jgi:signal transduction histidine kinase